MFQIVVDSAANIPAELVKKYDIRVISFVNYVNGKRIVCFDPDLTPEEERAKGREYYDAVRAGADVKTGLVSSGDFEDLFRSILEAGDDIL
ncbi:MAG: DegV family protein, partial [Lachnospiraceae bacterium]|nr:DegV family protein [Lachnospiraceae bacterium]